MFGEIGCELVEAGIEGAPGIAGIRRRLETMGHGFDRPHILAMPVMFVAHDGDRAEERTGEAIADRRK